MGILVCGAVMVDIKGYPLSQYIPRGRNSGRIVQVYGGVSRNIAEDIANMGLHPAFLSLVDDTMVGKDIVEKLAQRGVDTRYIRSVPDGHGIWMAIFGNNGDVAGSISKRPDLMQLMKTIDRYGDEMVRNADSVSIEMDMERELVERIMSLAKKYGKKIFAVVSNMSFLLEKRELLTQIDCFVCNEQEAGMLFSENYGNMDPQEMADVIEERARSANIARIVVTMGSRGAVYADTTVDTTVNDPDCRFKGVCPARNVDVIDTTGAGDAFFAGVTAGLTYGKDLKQSCEIGTRLASSVIATKESVCPVYKPAEFGFQM
ncbi:MAG: carbohydrate kinase family protein [Eubacteriales bacterium]|nr:carbohydrate kinase family protein [Eubacteriales bacterium]